MLKSFPGAQPGLAQLEKKLTGRDPDDSVVPAPVRKAVRFMLAGAVATVVFAVFEIIVLIAYRNAIGNINGQPPTSGQLAGSVIFVLVEYAIIACIWVMMARLNRAGRTWARIAATVLFALWTLNLYSVINSLTGGQTITVAGIIYIILTVAIWVAGLGATALLWRPESGADFRERSAVR